MSAQAPLPDDEADGSGPLEPTLVPPRGLVPALLLALLLVAATATLWPAAMETAVRPELTLEGWRDDVDAIAGRRDALLAATPALPEEATLTTGWQRWLALEAAQGPAVAQDAAARALLASLEEQVRGLALRHGNDAVLALAWRWAAGVATAREGGDVALAAAAPGMPALLARLALPPADDAGAQLLVEVLAVERMLALANRVPPPRPSLGSPEQRMVLAYRVERGADLALSRRLELLDALSAADPAYPRTFATGVLLLAGGKVRAAAASFTAAAIAGERRAAAQANARYARRLLRRQADGAAER